MEKNFIVYRHVSPSGKCYIGITSQLAEARWGSNGYNYLEVLKNGRLKHPYFAQAILKYGWDNIKHEILHENLSKVEACKLEQEYILKYKALGLSYNITNGGEGIWGFHFSEEQRRKLSENHKGKKQSSETVAKRVAKNTGKTRTNAQKAKTSKTVYQYSVDGEFIASYFGVREAGRCTGINSAHISDCCNHKPYRRTAGGYKWEWKQESNIVKSES